METNSAGDAGKAGTRGLTATLQRLQQSVEDQRHYEALQQYKALFYRSAARKKPEAVQILQEGANILLLHDQNEAGLELGLLLVNHFRTTDPEASAPAKQSIASVSNAFKSNSEARAKQIKFLTEAVEWSKGQEKGKCGDPALHQRLAEAHDAEGDAAAAHAHFVRGNDAAAFVAALGRWAAGAEEAERRLVGVRAVLQTLCVERIEAADSLLERVGRADGLELQTDCPEYNMCRLLIAACRKKAPPLFNLLTREYEATINSEPCFPECFARIGDIYFGIKQRKSGLQALFSGIFGGGGG